MPPGSPSEWFTAQVIMRAAEPKRPRRPVTVENVAEGLPDPAEVRAAQDFFRRAGLEVGPAFAAGFPLQGSLDRFAAIFAVDRSELEAIGRAGGELGLSALPESVRETIEAVVVTPPPDFGPTAP